MKMTFINPVLSPNVLNLGLAYVLASAEQKHQVKLLDLALHLRDYKRYVVDSLGKDTPDVIGFSVNSFTFNQSLEIAEIIKKRYPNIPFLFGGVHPTLLPEETLASPLVDAICIGEGEESVVEYLDKLEQGKEPNVAGIWYKDGNGRIIRNRLRPFQEDLDNIPFPKKDYFDLDKYLKWMSYMQGNLPYLASRGCPYNCTFCSSPEIRKLFSGRYHRLRNPEKIIEEIEQDETKYSKDGFKYIQFYDDTFGLNMEHLRQFCNLFKESGLHKRLGWTCHTRASVITEEWVKLASKSGCVGVGLGIESGDDYIRNEIYRKNITYKQILGANKILKEYGIISLFYMIFGCPGETRKSIRNSINLLRETKPSLASWSFYLPLPKTELTLQTEKESHSDKICVKEFGEYLRKYNRWQLRKLPSMTLRDCLIIKFGWIKEFAKLRRGYILIDIIKYIFSFIITWRYYSLKTCTSGKLLMGYLYSKSTLSRVKNSINRRE